MAVHGLARAGRAEQFRQRHSWHAPTGIYQTIIVPGAVLALLERSGEGPPEIIVDPLLLGDICQIGQLRPQRQRSAS